MGSERPSGERAWLPENISSFQEFWPYYVRWHLHPMNRLFHVVALVTATAVGLYGLFNLSWVFFLALPIGYGPAFLGHYLFESNRPATLQYPLWSFASDFLMVYKTLTFSLKADLTKAKSLQTGP